MIPNFLSPGVFAPMYSGATVGDIVLIRTLKRVYSEDGESFWPEIDETYAAEVVGSSYMTHTVSRLDNGEHCDVMDYDIVRKANPLEALAQSAE